MLLSLWKTVFLLFARTVNLYSDTTIFHFTRKSYQFQNKHHNLLGKLKVPVHFYYLRLFKIMLCPNRRNLATKRHDEAPLCGFVI